MKKGMRSLLSIAMIFIMAVSLLFVGAETGAAKTTAKTYKIYVNKTYNVCTVYKKYGTKYKPIRTMLVSCGRKGRYTTTPTGTFSVKTKWLWEMLYGGSYGRYATQFYRDYLFHSEGYSRYKNYKSMDVEGYKKLGKSISAGCVRMQFIDIKWLSKTCPKGTKVIVCTGKKAMPWGKPKAAPLNTKKKRSYDPTDPIKGNNVYSAKEPVITVNKVTSINKGENFDVKAGVKAIDSRTHQNLISKLKYKISKQNDDGTWSTKSKVDTASAGTYKIDYSCYYYYCSKKTGKKSITITVNEE